MQRVAKVWAEGATKYGEHNWELGFPMKTLFNHLLAHIFKYLSGDRSEDHLGHMSCNVIMLVVEESMRYNDNLADLRLPGNILSPEMKKAIEEFRLTKKQSNNQSNNQPEQKDQIDSNKFNPIPISITLLTLYQSGVLRYSAGCTVPFKDIARKYFSNRSYTKLRDDLKECGFQFDTEDNIINFEWRENSLD